MFVCVARVTLDIPASGSLKAKRQVLRRVTDRVKARFNVSVAEVEDNELAERAVVGMAVVSNEKRHAQEQVDKILQFVDELYVAPIAKREVETLSFGEDLFPTDGDEGGLGKPPTIPRGDRSLAEAEGLGAWEERDRTLHLVTASAPRPRPSKSAGKPGPVGPQSVEEARFKARSLRNPRDWEQKE